MDSHVLLMGQGKPMFPVHEYLRGIRSQKVPQLNNKIFLDPLTIKPEMCTPKLPQTVHRRPLGSIFVRFYRRGILVSKKV